MDVVTLALAKKYTDHLFSKVDSASISFVDELPTSPVEKQFTLFQKMKVNLTIYIMNICI